MSERRKYLVIMLTLIMSAMMMLPACGGGAREEDPQEEQKLEETQTEETDASYDIMKNFEKKADDDGSIEYLYFNDFMLVMPGNEKWSFEAAKDNQSVTFYLFSAQQEGYGGKLVTIMAYDMDDNSYEELPSYHVAGVGQNSGKRFIAMYPTDVQWNHEDSTQEADYRDLADYLKKIGEGAVNSPLQTADSNPEQ